jgi:low temperature requirement protein LtrA
MAGRLVPVGAQHKVSTLELFFDLVFVYGISQVTAYLAKHPDPLGFLQGGLLLALLWWSWVAYSWLGNNTVVGVGVVRWAMFGAMAAILVTALALPQWFAAGPGSTWSLVAAAAYLLVRVLHLVLFWAGSDGDPQLQRAVAMLGVSVLVAAGLLLGGAAIGGPVQLVLVVIAVAIDYSGPLWGRGQGWQLSPAHFAERHGLIVIIALGESLVALGVGAADLPLSAGMISTAAVGVALVSVLWVGYFDRTAHELEHQLCSAEGVPLVRMARDVYSYLHLVLVAGVVLVALSLKKAIAAVAEAGWGAVAPSSAAFALGAGLALFALGLLGVRRRAGLSSPGPLVLTPVVAAGVGAAAAVLPVLAALVLAAAAAGAAAWFSSPRSPVPA